jgi:type IV fimbrial biogenesis protein FimT
LRGKRGNGSIAYSAARTKNTDREEHVMRCALRLQAGITLIEIAITLAVIGALASMAAPSVRGLLDRHALSGSAGVLHADLQFARAASIETGSGVWVGVQHASDGACYLVYTGAQGDCSCDADGRGHCTGAGATLRVAGFPGQGHVQLSSNVGSLHVEPSRGAVTPAGTLTLSTAEGEAVALKVSLLGRVRACTPGPRVPGYAAC